MLLWQMSEEGIRRLRDCTFHIELEKHKISTFCRGTQRKTNKQTNKNPLFIKVIISTLVIVTTASLGRSVVVVI